MGERRPIAARSWGWSQRMAERLGRCGASPNRISIAGAIFGLLAGAALAATARLESEIGVRVCWLAAACGVQLRLLANMFDGMVAIATGRTSPVGELYNEVPDRVSDTAVLVGLGFAAGGAPQLGLWAALLALLTAYIRAVVKVAGAPQDFGGPLAKPQRMLVVTLTALWCALTPGAWHTLPAAMGGAEAATAALWLLLVGTALTCVLRLRRGAARLLGAGGADAM